MEWHSILVEASTGPVLRHAIGPAEAVCGLSQGILLPKEGMGMKRKHDVQMRFAAVLLELEAQTGPCLEIVFCWPGLSGQRSFVDLSKIELTA